MAKYVEYSYGSFDGNDSYTAYVLEGDKVFKVTRRESSFPVKETTSMTPAEYKAIPRREEEWR